MGFFGMTLLLEVALGIVLIAFFIYKYLTRNFDYWKKQGVPYVEPKLPFTSSSESDSSNFREHTNYIYKKYKGEQCVGMIVLTDPELMILDPELIKQVLTKDFSHFVDRSFLPDLPHDFLLKHLVHMKGDEWRRMRSKLAPTFTSGKMKLYFNLIDNVTNQLLDYLRPLAARKANVEIKELMARFTTDIIATCAFGLEANTINDPENKIRKIGRLMVTPSIRDLLATVIYPKVQWLCKILPLTRTQPEVSEFMLKLLTDTVDYRKKNGIVRGDFIDLLMKIKHNKLAEDKDDKEEDDSGYKETNRSSINASDELTLKEMAAQMAVFFIAGFETASSMTTFLLYELAVNQDIQEKLRNEIDTVIANNDDQFTYNCLQEMPYLDKCINETLRRYASLPFLSRKCVKTYKVPGSDIVIEEGIRLTIPTYPIHHDSEYYPDPFKYDPERFSEEMINSRPQYTFMPFGEGPRICIGKRFGYMQVQVAAIALLRNFELNLAPGIPTVLPISAKSILTNSEIPVELTLTKRKC